MPALQPVVSRRAHDVGGEIPAACGAAEQAAGPRRSLEETNLDFRRRLGLGRVSKTDGDLAAQLL